MSSIKISIIIPTYNRQDLVLRAVDSVLDQSADATELVVINDGSTDGTRDQLDGIQTAKNLIVRHLETNRGVNHARNLGVSLASGEYVLFLDSDEYILENGLKEVLATLNREDAAGHMWFVRLEEEKMQPWNRTYLQDGAFITFDQQVVRGFADIKGDHVHVLKRDYLLRYPFFEEFKQTGDINWMRILKAYPPVRFFDRPIVASRRESIDSLNREISDLSKIRNIEEKFLMGRKEIELFYNDYDASNPVYLKKLVSKTVLAGIAAARYKENEPLLFRLKKISFMNYLIYNLINKLRMRFFVLFMIRAKNILKKFR
jgi:glycosyltransferase involved in cell wall biosynthesis